MKTMNIKSTDYRVQITESGSVPGSVLAAIRKASVLCTLCSVLLISSCTHDEIIPPTPLAPQGTKTVTVDFQLPEGKPGFEVESGKMKDESTSTRATNSVLAEENLSSFNSQLSTRATTASWAEGDELLMTVDVSNNNNFAYAYLTLKYDGSAWDVVTDKSYARIILNNAATNYTYADYPLLDDITDLSLAEGLTLVLDEAFGEVTIYSVNATYAPELERNGVDDTGIALLKLKANATTTAPESWSAIASSEDASLTLQWNAYQARLRVHTGVAGDVVTLTSSAFSPNLPKSADGIYTATTDSEGNAYFYGTADSGVVDGSISHALTSGFNLSLTAVTVGEDDAAFTCPIAPVTLLEASTLVPVQLVGGKSYRLDATEKRPDTESFAVIDGTLGYEDLQTAIDAAIVARKTTLYVTGEPVGEIGSAISFSGAADGSIDLILADATAIGDNNAFLYSTALKSVSAPKATTIGEYAFDACSALTSVSLPAATTIEDGAFEYCTSLTSVSLPKATTIGVGAFGGTSLTSVSLPAAKSIGDNAFDGCTALKSVSLPEATSIGEYAFYECSALKSVSAPAATTIGGYAFTRCSALTSVSLPAAETIVEYAFEGCTALTSVSLPDVTKIGMYAFSSCTSLTSVSLPAATSIGNEAFYGCAALESVSLPAAKTIGINAFQACADLTSVSLPAAETIGNGAFFECSALTSVSAPKATSIGGSAFWSCDALTSLTFGSVIETVGANAFYSVPTTTTCDLTLNSGQLSSTDLAPSGNTWAGKTWASIRYVDDEGNAVTVIDGAATDADALKAQISAALAAGQSTIYVGGTTLGTALKSAINAQANGSIDLVLLDATEIGYQAFYGYTALKSVSALAATSIGDGAFYNCTALKSVELPAATSIGKYAFSECTVLTSVSAPKATSIDYQVFKNCSALTRLTFGVVNKVMSIAIYGGTFYLAPTENCDLTLGTGSTGNPEAGENKTWADKTWKSITLVGSN